MANIPASNPLDPHGADDRAAPISAPRAADSAGNGASNGSSRRSEALSVGTARAELTLEDGASKDDLWNAIKKIKNALK